MRLLVLGCKRWSPWVHRLIAQLDLGDSVILGNQERDPLRAYAAADVLALPTRQDPFANVTLEALSCGLPVVTSTCNGAVEAVGDCRAVWQVSEGDEDGLLAGLSQAVDASMDPGISEAARRAATACGRDRSVAAWEALLAGLSDVQGQEHV